MYRIRFHGRGGQGMKTAGRILGTAFFLEGFEVQDAPRYGAERRGAPIFAYVRADRAPINERGVIGRPDLVVVVDESLLAMPEAGVLSGCSAATVLLVHGDETGDTWQHRLNLAGPVVGLPPVGAVGPGGRAMYCAGAAARLLGVIGQPALSEAVQEELGGRGAVAVGSSLAHALLGFEALAEQAGLVRQGTVVAATDYEPPEWIELAAEPAGPARPAIRRPATTELVRTGLWRSRRPVINAQRCRRCWWICSTFCPDGAIAVDDQRRPRIDYEHCKGCMICLAQCPAHAIEVVPETGGADEGGEP